MGGHKTVAGDDVRFSYIDAHRNTLFHHNDKYERLLGHCVLPQPQEHYSYILISSWNYMERGFITLKATRD